MYLISSCLAGVNCRYDGRNSKNNTVMKIVEEGQAVLVCPEQLGGLPTPRPSCEQVMDTQLGKRVKSIDGRDVTEQFQNGAIKSLEIANAFGIKKAILKAKSPSCGCGWIYDGTFSGKLIEGNGLLAEILLLHGIQVVTEADLE